MARLEPVTPVARVGSTAPLVDAGAIGVNVDVGERPLRRRLPGGRLLRNGLTLYWWAEVTFAGLFYFVYSAIRNTNVSGGADARRNALEIIDVQQALGINVERQLQDLALAVEPLIIASNYFYGSMHFIVTIGVLVFLYRRFSNDYPLWRNTLAWTTALALVGFALYPLMPPRLMPAHYGFVDTLAAHPTFWSFDSGAISEISNQFAAMPSVHCAWALWCALVLVPRLRHRWSRTLAVLYPVTTVVVVVLTANHFLLDAVGGYAALGIGYGIARVVTRAGRAPPEPAPHPEPSAA